MNVSKFISSLFMTAALVIGSPATFSSQVPATPSPTTIAGELRFKAPSDWIAEDPSSSMRVAQYKLPGADANTENASLVLYFFGTNQGGSVQANLDRWVSQIQQPDGSPSAGKAKTETFNVNQLKITTIDLAGTYTAETAPGSGTKFNKPAYRLRAAVIETPRGAYYIKFVGLEKTVNRWDKSFASYLKSFEFK